MAEWQYPNSCYSSCGSSGGQVCGYLLNTQNIWRHDYNHKHWVILDLGETKLIEKVRFNISTYAEDRLSGVDVYITDDPENWGDAVATDLSFTTPSSWNERDVTPKAGRYIKCADIDTEAGDNCIYGRLFQVYAGPVPEDLSYGFIMG